MPNQSVFGSIITLKASPTFPVGILLTEFPDDNDPFDIPDLQIGDTAMGANGDLASWQTANPIELTISVMANGVDHENLNTLYEANRPEKGKLPSYDTITVTRVDPSGRKVEFKGGKIVSGTPMSSFASSGRVKNPTYTFRFTGTSSTAPILNAVSAVAALV